MKKVIFALLVAATALIGCGPNNGNTDKPDPKPDTFYGILIDQAMITNRGDYYNQDNGYTNLILRFSTLGEVEGEEVAVSYLTLEMDVELDADGRIPEGTYSVANGDLYPGEVQNLTSGSFFVDFTQSTIQNAYMFVNGGEVEVTHNSESEYRFDITLRGLNYEGGQGTPYEGRFEGEPDVVGLGATNSSYVRVDNFVMAEFGYLGATEDGKTALWDVILYDEGYFELLVSGTTNKLPAKALSFYMIAENQGPEALVKGTYPIDMLGTYSDNTILEASYMIIEEFEFNKETNQVNITKGGSDLLTDGHLKITPKGTETVGNIDYPVYNLEMVAFGIDDGYKFYYNDIANLYEPEPPTTATDINYEFSKVEALYWGELPADEAGTIMTKPMWYLQFNMEDPANGEQMMMMELFAKDGNTFADGIPSGTYEVMPLDENLDPTQPNKIFPGYYETNDAGGVSGIYGTYIVGGFETDEKTGETYFTMLFDCIQSGTMEVVNNGDGTYKLDVAFVGTGNMTYGNITGTYEGAITTVDGTATDEGTQVSAKAAAKQSARHQIKKAGSGRFEVVNSTSNGIVRPAKSTLFERNYR